MLSHRYNSRERTYHFRDATYYFQTDRQLSSLPRAIAIANLRALGATDLLLATKAISRTRATARVKFRSACSCSYSCMYDAGEQGTEGSTNEGANAYFHGHCVARPIQ